MTQHPTTLPEQQPMRAARHPRNVTDLERGLSLIGGVALVLYGMKVAQASVSGTQTLASVVEGAWVRSQDASF